MSVLEFAALPFEVRFNSISGCEVDEGKERKYDYTYVYTNILK